MKILIIKLSSIGDVVHTLPALHALRNTYPSAKIDWLVEEEASNILRGHPLLNEVFVIKKKGWLKDFKSQYNIVRKIQHNDYDVVLDFQGLFKSGIWVFLSKGRRRIGFDNARELSRLFLNERSPVYDPDIHAVDRYLDLVTSRLDIKVDEIVFPIPITATEKNNISELLKISGIEDKTPFIIINHAARWKTKLWGSEKFASLCNEIINKFPCKVIIVGASSRKGHKTETPSPCHLPIKGGEEKGEGVIDFTGKTTLKELAYLMSLSILVITVDSGPMHIAAAMNVPVIAIFGSTAPWRTGPYGSIHTVIRKELSCSPCFSRKCKDMTCMEGIGVEEVIRAVEVQLQKIRG